MDEKELTKKFENAAVNIIIAFLSILFCGTAILPAVLALSYNTWEWFLVYPVSLVTLVICVLHSRGKK